MKNLDWSHLAIGQMTAMFAALRQAQVAGRTTLGALGRELAATPATPANPAWRPLRQEEEPPEDEEEPEEAATSDEPAGTNAPVMLPQGMYVADRPDLGMPARLPSYHPSVTGHMDMAAGAASADERRITAVGRNLNKLFN